MVALEKQSFNEYVDFLKDAMQNLSEYWDKIGHKNSSINGVRAGLNNADPFVVYRATIAATVLLEDASIYH